MAVDRAAGLRSPDRGDVADGRAHEAGHRGSGGVGRTLADAAEVITATKQRATRTTTDESVRRAS